MKSYGLVTTLAPFFLPSLLFAPFFLLSHLSSSSHSHLPFLFPSSPPTTLSLPLPLLPPLSSLLFLSFSSSSFSAHLPYAWTCQILRGFHLHLHEVPSLSSVFFADILFYSLSVNHSDIFFNH